MDDMDRSKLVVLGGGAFVVIALIIIVFFLISGGGSSKKEHKVVTEEIEKKSLCDFKVSEVNYNLTDSVSRGNCTSKDSLLKINENVNNVFYLNGETFVVLIDDGFNFAVFNSDNELVWKSKFILNVSSAQLKIVDVFKTKDTYNVFLVDSASSTSVDYIKLSKDGNVLKNENYPFNNTIEFKGYMSTSNNARYYNVKIGSENRILSFDDEGFRYSDPVEANDKILYEYNDKMYGTHINGDNNKSMFIKDEYYQTIKESLLNYKVSELYRIDKYFYAVVKDESDIVLKLDEELNYVESIGVDYKGYKVDVVNDEIIFSKLKDNVFSYYVKEDGKYKEHTYKLKDINEFITDVEVKDYHFNGNNIVFEYYPKDFKDGDYLTSKLFLLSIKK